MVYALFLSLTFPLIAYLAAYRFGGWRWGAAFAGFAASVLLQDQLLRYMLTKYPYADTYFVVPDTDFIPVLILGACILFGVWWLMSRGATRLPVHLITALFAMGWAGWAMALAPTWHLQFADPEYTLLNIWSGNVPLWIKVSHFASGWLVLLSLGSTLLLIPITLVNIWRTRRDALRMDKTDTRG